MKLIMSVAGHEESLNHLPSRTKPISGGGSEKGRVLSSVATSTACDVATVRLRFSSNAQKETT